MSSRITIRQRARQDLLDHFAYIALENRDAADRFLNAAEETMEELGKHPGLGSVRDFGNPRLLGMRMRPVHGFKNYLIFYRATETGIEIIRVVHGKRDLPTLFREEE